MIPPRNTTNAILTLTGGQMDPDPTPLPRWRTVSR
ncbi:mgtA regulatory leader peptide MgtL [Kosakonia oryzae]|uniref:mgtA leader peptide n=1 Tax=Kosakonia oryzae TaxID=497725 RepID=A0ABX7PYW9_9ENTR|nr:mgtA regulatory leader peptide MgtL [Kosakonia oryzae]UDJ81926.1 mgtA regulatory leader peptide MgtL [Kosakonia oryzae]